ncbi:MAG: peroxiredoxin [Lysobacteraceae bacterium]|nr:MAG: peroxiredoxin [Xanthomonadaceae bacterium]
MSIAVGDAIPNVKIATMTPEGIEPVETSEFFKGKKVVLFSVPGAFTPTCSARHLPGFVDKAGDFKAKGVDTIACMSVNDVFVMGAWGKAQNVGENVVMLADGNGDFAAALGLEMDGTGFGMGKRSQRFALVADDGKVTALHVEGPGEFKVSSAEAVLATL